MKSSPLDDLTYDVITVLHNKAKALEAYDKYLVDAEEDDELSGIFRAMRRQDEEHVRVLTEQLAKRLDDQLDYAAEEEEGEEEDEAWDDGDVDEDEVDEIEAAVANADDEEGGEAEEAGEGNGADTVVETPPPRRGESTHRR